jgi:hypothetical protein
MQTKFETVTGLPGKKKKKIGDQLLLGRRCFLCISRFGGGGAGTIGTNANIQKRRDECPRVEPKKMCYGQ